MIKIFDEKFKIRVSLFIKETIDRDAKAFNFVKENGEANYNLFLNKLIPNLVKLNKDRREKAEYHQGHDIPLVMSNKKTKKNSTF